MGDCDGLLRGSQEGPDISTILCAPLFLAKLQLGEALCLHPSAPDVGDLVLHTELLWGTEGRTCLLAASPRTVGRWGGSA